MKQVGGFNSLSVRVTRNLHYFVKSDHVDANNMCKFFNLYFKDVSRHKPDVSMKIKRSLVKIGNYKKELSVIVKALDDTQLTSEIILKVKIRRVKHLQA